MVWPPAQGGQRAGYQAPSTLLERFSIKVHQCRPDDLPPTLAEHLADLISGTDASLMQVCGFEYRYLSREKGIDDNAEATDVPKRCSRRT